MADLPLSALQARVAAFVEEREWRRFHQPRNLAVSIAIEAAELLEHFQWLTAEESDARHQDEATRTALADELADVLIYALSFAEATAINPTDAILAKLARNEQRFPPDTVRARLGTRPGGGHEGAGEQGRGGERK